MGAVAIPVGRRQAVVAGLEWRTVSEAGGAAKREIRRYATELKASHWVRMETRREIDGDERLDITSGYLVRGAGRIPSSGLIAGGALFARSIGQTRAILLHRVVDDEVWMVGVMDGHPAPTFELVGPPNEVRAMVSRFLALPGNDDAVMYGNAPEVFPGQVLGEWEPQAALEMVGELVAKQIRLQPTSTVLQALPYVAVVSLVLAVGAGSLVGIKKYQEHKKQERLRRLAAIQQVDPVELYRSKMAEASAQWVPAKEAAGVLWSTIRSLPLDNGGWHLSAVDCAEACSATYSPLPMATNASFRQMSPMGLPQFGNNAITAPLLYPPIKPGRYQLEAIPELRQFQLGFGSVLQQLGYIGVTNTMAADKLNPIVSVVAPPNGQLKPWPDGFKQAQSAALRIGGPLALLPGVIDRLPPNAILKKLTVRFSDNSGQFDLEGEVHVLP